MSEQDLDILATRMQRLTYQLLKNSELCDQWAVAPYGLTISQGYTLLAFPPQEAVRMSELSESMDLANSTMTRMVDQLVQKELVQRDLDDTDRRVILVGLTPRGQEVQGALQTQFRAFFKLVLQELDLGERPVILDTLEKLSVAIEKAADVCAST